MKNREKTYLRLISDACTIQYTFCCFIIVIFVQNSLSLISIFGNKIFEIANVGRPLKRQLIKLFYLFPDFNLSVLERKSTGESSSSNQFSLTWKAYAVSIWKPCEPKPIFHCSAAILSRKILVTSLPEVVDEDVNKNIQVGYVVLVGPVDNVDAFVTKIENSMSIKQNNVWVGCTLLMVSYQINFIN